MHLIRACALSILRGAHSARLLALHAVATGAEAAGIAPTAAVPATTRGQSRAAGAFGTAVEPATERS